MHEQIEHLHFIKRWIATLSGSGGASESKDARPNDGANPQRGK